MPPGLYRAIACTLWTVIGTGTMTTFLGLSPERRATMVFACFMLITIAVAAVGDSMIRSLGAMSDELVLHEHSSLAAALRAETDLYKAQAALATLAERPSIAERRVTYASSAASTVDMINEFGTVQSLLGGNLLVAGLVRETLEAQADWSGAAQTLMQASESGADQAQIGAAWRSVQLKFDVLVSRMRRLHEAGLAPIVAGSHAALTASRLDARRTLALTLALALVVGTVLIVMTIHAIMRRRAHDEREMSYRDFDRRLQRAMQLVETEPEAFDAILIIARTRPCCVRSRVVAIASSTMRATTAPRTSTRSSPTLKASRSGLGRHEQARVGALRRRGHRRNAQAA